MFPLVGERTLECSWPLTVLSLGEAGAHRSCRTEADNHSFFLSLSTQYALIITIIENYLMFTRLIYHSDLI